ncbi:hypothetical protein N7474_003049 [Penicillium riverlandense]|uniref:uncharacterized protein n=1 Tax=Penicillium riverlandense TaxID=1903569 RepID=UPI0025472804|nr:uncharacterized protein N7474_003049 [Penicillium riverlandense]KAJ5825911.1 hypothetical protein N7474_003049 [Penicillium riverlandense]
MSMNTLNLRNGGILAGLPYSTSEYEYRGAKHFWKTIDAEVNLLDHDKTGDRSQYVIFTHLPEQKFLEEIDSEEFKFFDSYDPEFEILLLKMPTKAHELLSEEFAAELIAKFALEGMNDARRGLFQLGHARVDLPSRRKEPDKSYQPETLPAGRTDHFPSFIIETGFSESLGKLRNNATLWVTESSGDVKIALLMSTSKKTKGIVFEIFQPGHHRFTRGHPARVVAELKQKATVKTDKDGQVVADGRLRIPFEDLFLRRPISPEKDLIFSEGDLIFIARKVWSSQF